MVRADGSNGQVLVDDDVVVITRKGFGARIDWGNTPPKRIPIASITSVQIGWTGLTGLFTGYIRFVVVGNVESGPLEEKLESDPNVVLFFRNSKVDADFESVRAAVESRIIERTRPQQLVSPHAVSMSRAEQLRILGELRDSGILTIEEFEFEKSRVMLSGSESSHAEVVHPFSRAAGGTASDGGVGGAGMLRPVSSSGVATSGKSSLVSLLFRGCLALSTLGMSELGYRIYRKFKEIRVRAHGLEESL
jgi:hypothetical protein